MKLLTRLREGAESEPGQGSWKTLWVPTPRAGATKAERLRFVRDMVVRLNVFGLPIVVLAYAAGSSTTRLVLVIAWAWGVLDAAWLTWRIHRLGRAGP